jgi:GNAT superfamily N-acetyltransferase
MMLTITILSPSSDLKPFCSGRGLPPVAPDTLRRQRPDGYMLITHNGASFARCALWWREAPAYAGCRVGLVGHYAAHDPVAGLELLRSACAELRARGCDFVVGPMDGSTWESYRLVTEAGEEPLFLLEPANPVDWPEHFIAAGFAPFAHYASRIADDLQSDDPGLPPLKPGPQADTIRLRPLNLANLESELRIIYELALASFCDNLLYKELPWGSFAALYRPLLPALCPELATIAEHRGKPVGFIFGIPDLLQARRGVTVDTVILKTCGVLPEFRGCGLGRLLIANCRGQARQLGYRRAIYALMREGSVAHRLNLGTTRPLRCYALFGKELPS